MSAAPSDPLVIAIGVATCNRPVQLGRALASFHDILVPHGAGLVFVIIDNGGADQETATQVAAFQAAAKWPVHFVHEPRRGIPFARNAMLQTALDSGARYLMGLDDDEIATPHWVMHMLRALQSTDHVLIGGPIERRADPDVTLTRSEAWFLEALQQDAASDAAERGEQSRTKADFARIYTNNFGLDLDAIRRTGLRYDPSFALSGGEDSDFAQRLRDVEGKHGWAEDAIVVEILPQVRLHATYHMNRQKELAIMMTRLKGWGSARALWGSVETAYDALVLCFTAPFKGHEAKLLLLYKIGRCKGYLMAAFGSESRHYAPETEHLR